MVNREDSGQVGVAWRGPGCHDNGCHGRGDAMAANVDIVVEDIEATSTPPAGAALPDTVITIWTQMLQRWRTTLRYTGLGQVFSKKHRVRKRLCYRSGNNTINGSTTECGTANQGPTVPVRVVPHFS